MAVSTTRFAKDVCVKRVDAMVVDWTEVETFFADILEFDVWTPDFCVQVMAMVRRKYGAPRDYVLDRTWLTRRGDVRSLVTRMLHARYFVSPDEYLDMSVGSVVYVQTNPRSVMEGSRLAALRTLDTLSQTKYGVSTADASKTLQTILEGTGVLGREKAKRWWTLDVDDDRFVDAVGTVLHRFGVSSVVYKTQGGAHFLVRPSDFGACRSKVMEILNTFVIPREHRDGSIVQDCVCSFHEDCLIALPGTLQNGVLCRRMTTDILDVPNEGLLEWALSR